MVRGEDNKHKGPIKSSCVTVTLVHLWSGSGSLSSPMRKHRNFALFYCISVTNFSTISECILCLHCMCLEKSPIDFLREVFSVCPVPITRSETWTKTVDVFIRSVTKPYALYTAICGITGSEIECWFNFKPQNALKRLKHLPSKWSWIHTLSNEVWG